MLSTSTRQTDRSSFRAPAPAKPPRRRHAEPPRASAATARVATARRHRASGGPEDEATYACDCGAVYRAPVSTTVACPHCGTSEAW